MKCAEFGLMRIRKNFNAFKDLLTKYPPARQVLNYDSFGIYGAGELGQLCVELLQKIDRHPVAVWDRNRELAAKFEMRNQFPIKNKSLFKVGSVPVIVCVSKEPYNQVLASLSSLGFSKMLNFYDFFEQISGVTGFTNGWRFDNPTVVEVSALRGMISELTDQKSVEHLFHFLHWHRLRCDAQIKDFDPDIENIYFPDFIRKVIRQDEIFVDIGAHVGNVIRKFQDLSSGEFRQIIGIEPDPQNFSVAVNAIGTFDPRLRLYCVGVGNKMGMVPYSIGQNYISGAQPGANVMISEYAFDDFGFEPTFVKIHAEGRESEILTSGIRTLQQYRPIIAATIYHNRADLFEVLNIFDDILENYRLYFRCHSYLGTSAVLYGIPEERENKSS